LSKRELLSRARASLAVGRSIGPGPERGAELEPGAGGAGRLPRGEKLASLMAAAPGAGADRAVPVIGDPWGTPGDALRESPVRESTARPGAGAVAAGRGAPLKALSGLVGAGRRLERGMASAVELARLPLRLSAVASRSLRRLPKSALGLRLAAP
jgi:hypothetical protein